jgi:uncharacterized protein YlxP (DUF503 family)
MLLVPTNNRTTPMLAVCTPSVSQSRVCETDVWQTTSIAIASVPVAVRTLPASDLLSMRKKYEIDNSTATQCEKQQAAPVSNATMTSDVSSAALVLSHNAMCRETSEHCFVS